VKDVDVEKYFVMSNVQDILKRITGFDAPKVFGERKIVDVDPPKYRLLTLNQLNEQTQASIKYGSKLLQIPPAKKPWTSNTRTLSKDQIPNFEQTECQYIFTDITYGLPHRQRIVVVRESCGLIRLASREEHDRILQVYYPRQGKMYSVPKLFAEENIEKILNEHRYEYLLDRACVQFEPDDPNYIQVSHRAYEHIANAGRFNDLRSTRHFGALAFYLTVNKRIDALLIDMIQHERLTDATDLIKLYHILHPQCKSAREITNGKKTDPTHIIQLYIQFEAANSGAVELALESYNNLHQNLLSEFEI